MADRYHSSFTSQINDILNDALRTGNFGTLNRNINDTIRRAIHDDPEIKLSRDPEDVPEAETAPVGGKIPVASSPAGSYSGTILLVIGAFGIGVFGGAALLTIMAGAVLNSSETLAATIVLAALTAVCVGVVAQGRRIQKRLRRFREYLNAMNGDEFCEIRTLAAQCHTTEDEATRELSQMIEKRMFLEGHLDDRREWFIGNNAMYRRYLDAQRNYEQKKQDAAQAAQAEASRPADERQLQAVLEQGRISVKKIQEANTALPGEEISRQLDRLENLVKGIFERVEEKPSLLPQIQKFMDYYLPTTVKLVETYRQLEEQNITSEAATKAKKEIEDTLGTIEEAFTRLQEDLYRETVMDVTADISVLKSMLARDGLGEKVFESVK